TRSSGSRPSARNSVAVVRSTSRSSAALAEKSVLTPEPAQIVGPISAPGAHRTPGGETNAACQMRCAHLTYGGQAGTSAEDRADDFQQRRGNVLVVGQRLDQHGAAGLHRVHAVVDQAGGV